VAVVNRRLIFAAGGLVAVAAAAATAHGMYETAVAAGVGEGMAITYPIMFDGQALVAYAATTRLRGLGRWYAWAVVVLSAALSGLAQAAYLGTGKELQAAPELAFGIGAWPALAWTVTAHLLYLLASAEDPADEQDDEQDPIDREYAELFDADLLDEHGTSRAWETAPPADRPTDEPTDRPPPPGRADRDADETVITDLVDAARNGTPLPTKWQLRQTGMGPGRADRLLSAAADRLKESTP
jgi:hypothetical protein